MLGVALVRDERGRAARAASARAASAPTKASATTGAQRRSPYPGSTKSSASRGDALEVLARGEAPVAGPSSAASGETPP